MARRQRGAENIIGEEARHRLDVDCRGPGKLPGTLGGSIQAVGSCGMI